MLKNKAPESGNESEGLRKSLKDSGGEKPIKSKRYSAG